MLSSIFFERYEEVDIFRQKEEAYSCSCHSKTD